MQATLLNGCARADGRSQAVFELLAAELIQQGWQVTCFTLRDCRITHCRGCFACWTKRPGLCKFADDAREITRTLIAGDLSVFFTPVTFGGYSAELKKALDRCIGLLLPFFATIDGEVHHQKRYAHCPRLLVIGTLPQPDPESEMIFRRLAQRNAVNLHTTAATTVLYLGQEHAAGHLPAIQALLAELEAVL